MKGLIYLNERAILLVNFIVVFKLDKNRFIAIDRRQFDVGRVCHEKRSYEIDRANTWTEINKIVREIPPKQKSLKITCASTNTHHCVKHDFTLKVVWQIFDETFAINLGTEEIVSEISLMLKILCSCLNQEISSSVPVVANNKY